MTQVHKYVLGVVQGRKCHSILEHIIAQMGKDLILTNACGDISIREHFIRSRFVSEKQETIVLSVSQSEFKGSTPLLATIKF